MALLLALAQRLSLGKTCPAHDDLAWRVCEIDLMLRFWPDLTGECPGGVDFVLLKKAPRRLLDAFALSDPPCFVRELGNAGGV